MYRDRCYVALLSLSILYFFYTTHAHSLHTPYAVAKKKKKKKESKKKRKTAY